VIVLESFAVLALLRDEPAAALVQQLVESDEDVALTALGVAEVLDHLVRLLRADEDEAVLDVAQLGLTPPTSIDVSVAMQAGLLRARHYQRKNRAVSLADCVAAASARLSNARLASADPQLLDMCRNEGIDVVALPDSTGHTWSP
jgi:predicted nucleic acid-binding protein